MCTFADCLNELGLDNEEIIRISKTLDNLRLNGDQKIYRICYNLDLENLAPRRFVKEVIALLRAVPSPSVDEFTGIYCDNSENICNRYQLQGPVIQFDSPSISFFGHVVEKKKLIRKILKSPGNIENGLREEKIAEFLGDFGNEDFNLDEVSNNLDRIKNLIWDSDINNRNMWATWDENGSDDPFDFMQTRNTNSCVPTLGSPCEILWSLGLDYGRLEAQGNVNFDENGAVMLLTYNRRDIEAHYPTMPDARDNPYFRPSDEGRQWGLTDPDHIELRDKYSQCLLNSGYDAIQGLKRPEAVHSPIKVRQLTKIEELHTCT